jgi:two-component sensor histidine kinase
MRGLTLRVLVVEDSLADMRLLKEMFATEPPHSYELHHAARLDTALQLLAAGGVDIILLDMGLPDGEGIETVRQVRKVAPKVPLVILTGRDDEELVAESIREGAQEYLVKGHVETRALPRALRHAVERFAMVTEAAAANLELQKRMREKEVLLAEIHHRVKNNLQVISSLLSMEAGRAQEPETAAMLRVTQNRILAMATIHKTLYESNDFAQVDFDAFVRSFVPSLIQIYSVRNGQVALDINVTNGGLPLDVAIPCGLIVNELISNALKHAFPNGRDGIIRIDFTHDEETVVFSVEDNGIGLPKDFSFENDQTLGVQLVQVLSRQLGGTVTAHRSDWTRFQVRFPLVSDANLNPARARTFVSEPNSAD